MTPPTPIQNYTTHIGHSVQAQIHRVPQLPTHSTIPQHRIHVLRIGRNRRKLEVLDILAQSERLSRKSELLLDILEGGNEGSLCGATREIPGVEASEVLEGAEELVSANWENVSERVGRVELEGRDLWSLHSEGSGILLDGR